MPDRCGGRTFYSYRKVNNRPERGRIGKWPEWTVENARDEAARIAGKAPDGITPNTQRRADRATPTLGTVFADFIDAPTRTCAKRPKSEKTKHGYRYQFDRFLAPWKNRQLNTINRQAVEKLHNQIADTSGGLYLANRVLALLKAIFNHAIDAGQYNTNPAARLRGREEVKRDRFLEADELPKFFEALEAEPNEKIRDFVKVALFTGQRLGNVLAMRWQDVNLQRAVWTIPLTKNGKPHSVPLVGMALETLKRRAGEKGEGDYVFPGRHGKEHLQDPMRQWREILQRAGIENLRIHDLRRSLATWQTTTGANSQFLGKTLGHLDPASTAIYARAASEAVKKSMETAGAAILAAAAPKKARKRKGVTNG